jgi:ketosteroid isomerase-like protein
LWTDDAVRLEPGGPADVGKQAIVSRDEKQKADHAGTIILTYEPEIKDVVFAGDWVFEWGYFNSSYKKTPDSPVLSFRGKLMRVLRRQPDGSWKFSHVTWNEVE